EEQDAGAGHRPARALAEPDQRVQVVPLVAGQGDDVPLRRHVGSPTGVLDGGGARAAAAGMLYGADPGAAGGVEIDSTTPASTPRKSQASAAHGSRGPRGSEVDPP